MNLSLKSQTNKTKTGDSINTSTEELEFDFDFDDLEDNVSDANDDTTHEERPYQWGTNIQFVNIDVNTISLKNRASNSFHHTRSHLHYHNSQEMNHSHRKPITLSNVNNDSQTVPHANQQQHNHRQSTLVPLNRHNNVPLIKLSRQISTFSPRLYDICSVISHPLSIEHTTNVPLSSLEYIRSYLPDSNEFNDYLYDILHQSGYKLRVANYTATVDNISSMLNRGGSKVLHFIAYVWNPMSTTQIAQHHPLSYSFPAHDEYYKCDTDYILIERSSFTEYGNNGKWIKVRDLQRMIKFDINLNDIIITISPQSAQLCNVFRNVFGYKYVIGVQCESNNYNAFSSTETAIFLKYFYSSILHQECLDRAFELAKTAAVLQRNGAAVDPDSDTTYILLTHNDNNSARFVAFPHLVEGKPLNVSPHTNYNNIKTNLRRIIRPFIGRASDSIRLVHNIIHHKASLVIGEENNGRAAVIHNTVRYLLQHLYFGACFVIDLEDKRNETTLIGRLYDALRDEIDIECDEDLNNDKLSSNECTKNLFRKLNNDTLFDSICIIILNMNQWKNHQEIFEFIHIFNTETNDKCRILLSTDIVSYNLNLLHSNMPLINVHALNKEDVSQVFESYLINKESYDIKNIMLHTKLHHILKGSARIAKRVAEFVNSECINIKLTLDQIAEKYPKSAFAKSMAPKLLTINIPHAHNNHRKDTISYAGWNTMNTSFAQINNDHEAWELSRRCDSFEASSLIHTKHIAHDHIPPVPNGNIGNCWNVSYSAKPNTIHTRSRYYSDDTYSSTDYDDTYNYSRNSRSASEDSSMQNLSDTDDINTENNIADAAIYTHSSGFLAIKNISIATPRDHRLTGAGLRKRLSPRAHRRHNTYSIPDFCTAADDPITNMFTNIEQIPEATEEEYTYQLKNRCSNNNNNSKVLYNLLNNIDPKDSDDDEYSLSFPDISKINANRNPFEIVVNDEHSNRLPLTPTVSNKKQSIALYEEPLLISRSQIANHITRQLSSQKSDASIITSYQPTANAQKNRKQHYKQIESMDFEGLSTYTTSTKQVATRHQQEHNDVLQLNLYNNTSYQVQQPMNSMTKSSQSSEYRYGYPESTEYDSGSDEMEENIKIAIALNTCSNTTTKPLQLSPKDSDEPVVDMHLAKICTDNKLNIKHSISGYNSGSDDTLHTDETPSPILNKNYHLIASYHDYHPHHVHNIPITPKQRSSAYTIAEDIDSDTIVEDVESETCIAPHDIITKKGSIVVQYGQHSSTLSLSNKQVYDITDTLSLMGAEHDDNDCDEEDDEINLHNLNNIDVSLNVIAHLSRIKDPDAKAIWMQAGSGSQYNQYTYLYKLYPFLVKKFQVTTRTKHRYPQIQELEHYFLKMGGKYLRNTNFPVIHIRKYNKFYGWFMFMCSIVSDLRQIYDDYNLECLFYGKRTSSEILKIRPQGTFVLSLTNKVNCLSIKYKKTHKSKEVSTILLMRHATNLYSVIKNTSADNQNIPSSLYTIIRPRTYLKYLYTPQMLIDKKALF